MVIERLFPLLLISLLGWHSGIVNSAIIIKNGDALPPPPAAPHSTQDELNNPNITVPLFKEALTEYAELTNAYYAPAENEGIREKRTLGVLRRLANATRSGFSSIRSLFAGAGGSSSGTGGFRSFFSNLLNRILIFMTNLWDRITGFFGRNESSGGSGSGGLLGRLGGLFSIFRPPTTTESYFDSDFSYYSTPSSSSTEVKEKENEVGANTDDAAVGGTNTESKGKDLDSDKDNTAGNESGDDFIPFPGESDLNSRSGKALERDINPVALAVKTDEGDPHVVKSPSIIHLIDDGRRFA